MNRTLKLRPESFDGVGMHFAANIFSASVLNRFVKMSKCLHAVVAVRFVGSDNRVRRNHSHDQRHQCSHLHVSNGFGLDFPPAFDRSEHGRFAFCSASSLPFAATANVGFIGLNDIIKAERSTVLGHQKSNLFSDSPGAFVSNSKMPFQFLRGYSVLALAHQKDGVKPERQRRGAFVKDRSLGRIDLKAARASIRPAILNRMKCCLSALRASRPGRVSLFEDMRQASAVIGKVTAEVFDGVFHALNVTHYLLVVKVYLP